MPDNNDIDQAVQKAVNSITKSINAGQKVSDAQLRGFLNSVGKAEDGANQASSSFRRVSSAAQSTSSAMLGFAGQLGRGNTAFTVVNTAIRGVSDGLGNLAKMIPIVGDGIAGLVGQVGKAAEFSVEQIEAGYGAFNQLSDVGLIGSKGIKGLAEDFAEAGIPLKTYTALLSNSSQKLAKMNGTAHDVSQTFAESMGQMRGETQKGINGIDNQLRLLGYSTEDISETFINYADLQRRLGHEQSFNSQTLKDGTVAYAKELDLVAKITGMSRKEQQKVVEAAMAESRWRATLMGAGEKQQLQMNALNNGLTAFSGELAQGMRDQATGFTQSEAAQRLFRSTGGASAKIMQQLNAGQITGHQALIMFQDAIKSNMEPMTALAKATGNQAGVYTDYARNVDFAKASIKDLGKATQTQAKQTTDPGKLTQGAVGAVNALEDASTKISAMFMDSENTAKALRGFADATNMAAEAAYNLFLTGDKVNAPRTATASEIKKQRLTKRKTSLENEYDSLENFIFPEDKDTKQRMSEITSELDIVNKELKQTTDKVNKDRVARLKSTTDMFSEFGLTSKYFENFGGAAKHKDGWAQFQGMVEAKVLGKGMNVTHVEPEILEKAKNVISASGKTGEQLMAPTAENKELWKTVNEILSRFNKPEVDYDSTQQGVQDTAPEAQQNIKEQTDALNNMNSKLDTIARNTDKLVTNAKQTLANA